VVMSLGGLPRPRVQGMAHLNVILAETLNFRNIPISLLTGLCRANVTGPDSAKIVDQDDVARSRSARRVELLTAGRPIK
jgi:hypothetical protein